MSEKNEPVDFWGHPIGRSGRQEFASIAMTHPDPNEKPSPIPKHIRERLDRIVTVLLVNKMGDVADSLIQCKTDIHEEFAIIERNRERTYAEKASQAMAEAEKFMAAESERIWETMVANVTKAIREGKHNEPADPELMARIFKPAAKQPPRPANGTRGSGRSPRTGPSAQRPTRGSGKTSPSRSATGKPSRSSGSGASPKTPRKATARPKRTARKSPRTG